MLKSVVIEEKKNKHSPWAGADNPLGGKFWCQQEGLITMVICCNFIKESLRPLTLYTSFHDFINVYSRRSGADSPRGQILMSTETSLSLRSFATSLKKMSLESDFIQYFPWFYSWKYPRGRGWQALGDDIFMSTGTSCHFGYLLQVKKKSLWSLTL